MKNAFKKFISRLNTAEERISEHELKLVEITQTKAQRRIESKKKTKQNKQQKKTNRAEHPGASRQYQMA